MGRVKELGKALSRVGNPITVGQFTLRQFNPGTGSVWVEKAGAQGQWQFNAEELEDVLAKLCAERPF